LNIQFKQHSYNCFSRVNVFLNDIIHLMEKRLRKTFEEMINCTFCNQRGSMCLGPAFPNLWSVNI
jgi:hypothetical protein